MVEIKMGKWREWKLDFNWKLLFLRNKASVQVKNINWPVQKNFVQKY